MGNSRLLPCLGIALVLLGCTAGEEGRTPGVVRVDGASWALGRIHVQPGVHWVGGGGAPQAAKVGRDGVFSLDAKYTVATAFVDLDGDGRYSPILEPSTPCHRGSTWSCVLRPNQVSVHRSDRQLLGAWKTASYVVGAAYDPVTGNREPEARLCSIEDGHVACADRSTGPYLNVDEAAEVLWLCEWADSDQAVQPRHLRLRTDAGDLHVVVEQPETMRLEVDVDRVGNDYAVRVRAPLTIDRSLAWTGHIEANRTTRVDWTSEIEPGRLRNSGRELSIRIPVKQVRSDGTLVVQVSHLTRKTKLVSYSNAEVLLTNRELP